jgi:SAM-dependent methyltransferase
MRGRGLSEVAAAAVVFGASGAVLVLEILAVRMLAPYVGLTLETYTTIIGVVLAGIALGSWLGGRLADAVAPQLLLGPLLVLGGLLAMLTVPAVRLFGEAAGDDQRSGAVLVGLLSFLPPAAVLSAVTPATAKLQLGDLGQTGAVVGRLSAWATAGALTGTFATGFVLVPIVPTRASVVAVAAALVLAGVALGVRLEGWRRARAAVALAAGLVLAGGGVAVGSRCDAESAYFCAEVVRDEARPSGRVLVLDGLRHSYVDLADPRHLEFAYVRRIGDVADVLRPPGAPLEGVFLGGGGFTLPRYLLATRPGSRATVLEIDQRLVELARERLGLSSSPALRVRVGDARISLRAVPTRSADLVVGDAFGGLAVPWHLATQEFLADVRRVLRPDGVYALNLIDLGPLRLARAEAATLLRVFPDAALVAAPSADGGPQGGNLVFLASRRTLPLAAVRARLGARGGEQRAVVLDRAALARFAGSAQPLSDDSAPADQLLTPPDR